MSRFYYDLHIHSCLSPCADDDNTPNNLAGMASISGLDVIALTDHNSCKNCPAFFTAARRYGIIPIAGMELTTAEDIHVVCLFEELESALRFDEELQKHRVLIPNKPKIFGEQLILDENDELIAKEETLLSNATTLSIEQVPDFVERFDGICYPAHIDRDANGIIAILGTIPKTPYFNSVEIRDSERIPELTEKYALEKKHIIISSDAHYLTGIKDGENYFELDADKTDESEVRRQIFSLLKAKL